MAAELGSTVQLVGRIGDDPHADAVLHDLVTRGVGHVAILRDPSHPTPVGDDETAPGPGLAIEGADVELALRYLTEFAVLVVIDGDVAIRSVAERAAAWGGARLILIGGIGAGLTPASGETPDAFAARAAALAVELDQAAATVRSVR